MIEIAIIGSDMQEVIGTATAIYLLSNRVWVTANTTSILTDYHALRAHRNCKQSEVYSIISDSRGRVHTIGIEAKLLELIRVCIWNRCWNINNLIRHL